jgi:hypothetical protein
VIRPDAIPLLDGASRATLTPAAIETLFGKGYRLRGGERVKLAAGELSIQIASGAVLSVVLDRLDADVAGSGTLTLAGPRGTVGAPPAGLLVRALVLPAGLRRAWRLEAGQRVALTAGDVLWTSVAVREGEAAGAVLDRADRLAAGLSKDATVALRRDIAAHDPNPTTAGTSDASGGLITENDVRQARLHGRRIAVRPGQIVTPAARSLGKELGVLDWTTS